MDEDNFVGQDPEGGGFVVYVGGEPVGTYPTQDAAQRAYNDATGQPNAPAGGRPSGGGGNVYLRGGWENDALMAQVNLGKARLEFDYARMEAIERPTMESQNRLREAQTKLTLAQEELARANFAFDKEKFGVGTAMDIWKQRQDQARRSRETAGFGGIDVEKEEELELPVLPRGYMPGDVAKGREEGDVRDMWEWGKRMRAQGPVSRDQWISRWGDAGGKLFDWAARSGMSASYTPVEDFLKGFPGMGGGPQGEQSTLRSAWDWGKAERARRGTPLSRQDWVSTWGDVGGRLYDTAAQNRLNPSANSFEEFKKVYPGMGAQPGSGEPGPMGTGPRRGIEPPGFGGPLPSPYDEIRNPSPPTFGPRPDSGAFPNESWAGPDGLGESLGTLPPKGPAQPYPGDKEFLGNMPVQTYNWRDAFKRGW